MPIGLTPGHLSNGISRQATKALRPSGLTKEVQSLRPTAAREEQRSLEADLNEEHSLRHANASIPERPAAPPCVIAALVYYAVSSRVRLLLHDSLVPDPGSRSRLQHLAHVYNGCAARGKCSMNTF